jgi:gamma-glutamyltranspeptidase / glutathione hydrolase
MRRRTLLLVVASVVAAVAGSLIPPSIAAGAAHAPAGHLVATGSGGAVASMESHASQAGITVLKQGGNAVDAAVATAAALGVTNPFVAGPGGGGFITAYLARSHRVINIDGREACPAACTPTMFINPKTGKPLSFGLAGRSGIGMGVPGMVATWATAVRRYGRLSLAKDLQPAIRLAQMGFRVNADFHQLEQVSIADLRAFSSTRRLFLTPSGNPLPVGYLLKNPDLARTYRLIARFGPGAVYHGPVGAAIVRAVDHPPVAPQTKLKVLPGFMKMSDLRSYRTRILTPTKISYRGLSVYSMPPPSSGGSTISEILNILGGYRLGAESQALRLFHYLEASRLAFADRDAYIGDPRYVGVPLRGLLSRGFAATRRCLIHLTALVSPVAPGDPYPPYARCQPAKTAASSGWGMGYEVRGADQTNNIVAADRFGNVVSYTNTLNSFGGSGMVVPGTGFLLNNEIICFDFEPSAPGVFDPNLAAPGKQPRSSMGPTIVLRNGKPAFTVGAAGGATIITTIAGIIIDHVDLGMSLPAAMDAPRVAQLNSPTSLAEPAFYRSPVRKILTSRYGEAFTEATGPLEADRQFSDATAIQILGRDRFQAVADPRLYGGTALVVHPGP